MEVITTLKNKRKTVKGSLTRISNYLQRDNLQVEDVQARIEAAQESYKNYVKIQDDIDELTISESEKEVEEAYRADMEEVFFSIKSVYYKIQNNTSAIQHEVSENHELTTAMQTLIQTQSSMSSLIERLANNTRIENNTPPSFNSQQQHSTSVSNLNLQQLPNTATEIKLPRIQLPDFDGNLLNWIRFKELFEVTIHNRSNLAAIEKFEYLQSKIKGEALLTIKHLTPSNDNYTVAWEILNNKYNNMEKIKAGYMELLCEQAAMRALSLSETKRLYNNTCESFNALKALDASVDQWCSILLFQLEKKLDSNTAALWFREGSQGEQTTFQQFLKFLEKRIFELEKMQNSHHHTQQTKDYPKRSQTRTYTAAIRVCPVCGKQHMIFQCDTFKKMIVEKRRSIVQKHGLCFNCLYENHKASECKSSSCKVCGKRHNTLLHLSSTQEASEDAQVSTSTVAETTNFQIVDEAHSKTLSNVVSLSMSQPMQHACVVLPTAIIMVLDSTGLKQKCRALLDTGSQSTLITEACAQRLNLKKKYDKTIIFGLNSNCGRQTKGSVKLQIKTNVANKTIITEALCLISLTQMLPMAEIIEKQQCFQELQLADPTWYLPGPIDIILGADVFTECCLAEKIVHPSGTPTALKTTFGWVIMGKSHSTNYNRIVSNYASLQLDQQMQRFWEVEEIAAAAEILSPEEEQAEKFYAETTRRDNSGRYVVKLPIKNDNIDIGESKSCALSRLMMMEKRFKRAPHLGEQYKQFINEYIQLGHMELINEMECQNLCFLPHHAVIKSTSTTTKLRVVFDASCKTSNGKSLNDNLLIGAKVQSDLFDIITQFRLYAVAFTGDIEKMYRQVLVDVNDRPLQCIVWRFNENEKVKSYCLNTVTYGTSSAAFLATRTLKQIANDNVDSNAVAAKAISEKFYVDDFMCSIETVEQAIQLKNDLCSIMSKAGFHIRKWASNSASFLATTPSMDRANSFNTQIQQSSTVSTLGLQWHILDDQFKYSINISTIPPIITKRVVLSDIAKIYDPMGWIAPVIICMKIFMQKLWLIGIDWDQPLPNNLVAEWTQLRESIPDLTKIKINRWIQHKEEKCLELHGYADASELAYAAVVYAKVHDHQGISTHLLAAKTRVAPVKQISLPRLELCAAHLLVKLLRIVQKSLKLTNVIMHGWTDSTIVLAWLSDHPRRWKSFVANRTSQIISTVPAHFWHHVKSQQNPADLATRGVQPNQLLNSKLWWNGPEDLRVKDLPTYRSNNVPHHCDMEERKTIVININLKKEHHFINNYSSFSKLMRTTVIIFRFVHNCRNKANKHTGFIKTPELRNAHDALIKYSQLQSYAQEIKMLSTGRQLPATHQLSSVTPFIDEHGLLRVGGRIVNANISYSQKHPLILNGKEHLTRLIIRHFHIQHCHAGSRLLYHMVHLKYWILAATRAIKDCIYKCSICMRQRAKPFSQQMGNVPKHRLAPAPVFTNVGVDFAGPISTRARKGRGAKTFKCWIAIFVCLVTKAIHIELVTELNTAAFIGTLRRFTA